MFTTHRSVNLDNWKIHLGTCLKALLSGFFTLMLLINCRSADAAQGASAAITNAPTLIERITITPVQPELDGNIQGRYEIEKAAWGWHPAMAQGTEAVLLFRNEFTLTKDEVVTLHVSADQRYELSLDGSLISLGPDRGDLMHWLTASRPFRRQGICMAQKSKFNYV